MHQDPGEGNSDPKDLPVGVRESPVKAWVGGGLLHQAGGMDCSSTCLRSFEGGNHYLHYTIVSDHHATWEILYQVLNTIYSTYMRSLEQSSSYSQKVHCINRCQGPGLVLGKREGVGWGGGMGVSV